MPAKGSRKSKSGARKEARSGSSKAGVHFPVARLTRLLKQGRYCQRVSVSAGAFMAAVLDYLTREIVDAAGGIAEQDKMTRLKPKHINLAVRGDGELDKLMSTTQISEGGMLPHIEPGAYLRVERQKMKKAENAASQKV